MIIRVPPEKFKVGDRVRLLLNRNIFTKGTVGRYSETVYKIESILGLGYELENRDGKVFNWQLKKVDIVQKNITGNIQELQEKNQKHNRLKRKLSAISNMLDEK